jgi:undecaprenyl-diphosphatase
MGSVPGLDVPLTTRVALSDVMVSRRLRTWRQPRWFRAWMLATSHFSNGWIWLLVVAWSVVFDRSLLMLMIVASGLSNVTLIVLKGLVRRPRPCDAFPGAMFVERPPRYFPSDNRSFPSGHVINAFAVGSVIAFGYPAAVLGIALIALSIALSRIVLGLHYLTDVLAGALLGMAIGSGIFVWLRW